MLRSQILALANTMASSSWIWKERRRARDPWELTRVAEPVRVVE